MSGLDGLLLHLLCEQALKFDQHLGLTGVEDWTRVQEGAYRARIANEEVFDDGEVSVTAQLLDQEAASDERSPYHCDDRTHCSQMTSCEEAEFFLANCPGVKMDGGGDGVPSIMSVRNRATSRRQNAVNVSS